MESIETGLGGEVPLHVGALAVGIVAGVVNLALHLIDGGSIFGGLVRGVATVITVGAAFYLGLRLRARV